MNYSIANMLKDGAMAQLQNITKLYRDGYITAEECAQESNEILYAFISALIDSGVDCDCIEMQHTINFDIYRSWVAGRIADKDE